MLHIGKKIRAVLLEQQMPVSVFAKKIKRSRNVVYDIFERESVDTNLLFAISKVLQYDFFSFYKTKNTSTNENSDLTDTSLNKLQEQEISALKNEITYLKKIITLLEQKK